MTGWKIRCLLCNITFIHTTRLGAMKLWGYHYGTFHG